MSARAEYAAFVTRSIQNANSTDKEVADQLPVVSTLVRLKRGDALQPGDILVRQATIYDPMSFIEFIGFSDENVMQFVPLESQIVRTVRITETTSRYRLGGVDDYVKTNGKHTGDERRVRELTDWVTDKDGTYFVFSYHRRVYFHKTAIGAVHVVRRLDPPEYD